MNPNLSSKNNPHYFRSGSSKILRCNGQHQGFRIEQNCSVLKQLVSLYQKSPRDNFLIKARFPKLEIIHEKCLQDIQKNQNNYFYRRNSEPFIVENQIRMHKQKTQIKTKQNKYASQAQYSRYSSQSNHRRISLFSQILSNQESSKNNPNLENTRFSRRQQKNKSRNFSGSNTRDFYNQQTESIYQKNITLDNIQNIHEYSFSHQRSQQTGNEMTSNQTIERNYQKGEQSQILRQKQTSSFSLNSSFGDLIGLNPERIELNQKGSFHQQKNKKSLYQIQEDQKQSEYSSKRGSKISNQDTNIKKNDSIGGNFEQFKKSLSLIIDDQNKRNQLIQLARNSYNLEDYDRNILQLVNKRQQSSNSPRKILSMHFAEHLRTLNHQAVPEQQICIRRKCSRTIRVVHQEQDLVTQSIQSFHQTQATSMRKNNKDQDFQCIRQIDCLGIINPEVEQSY